MGRLPFLIFRFVQNAVFSLPSSPSSFQNAVVAYAFLKRRRRLCRLQNAVFSLPLSPFLPSKRRLFLRLRSVRWRVLDVGDAGLWDVLAEMRFYVDRDKVKKD